MQSNIRHILKTVALLMFGAAIALFLSNCRADNRSLDQAEPTATENATNAAEPTGCVTLISDPAAPITNVFSNPEEQSSEILDELPNNTEVVVTGYQNGWLQISSPAAGWVFLGATTVSCGDTAAIQTLTNNVNTLKEQAIGGDRLAADTLIRYAFQADGAGTELALGAITEWAQTNPELLISVLDEQPQSVRNGVLSLLKFSLSPDAQSAFEAALIEQNSNSPTAQAWQRGD
ncbi:MAG: SH3 domain-containing protein [Leptolyngbyaceae cyanobacterium RM2_2_4]|nr:SH3 domain-containing protein [Leptolyngbyaceae cyanobacterium SM1_4_3]NJO49364.1 SH3 domain-containing protein [Leptolyngbyaceae cyanobacterium RM2_2_4]